MARGTHYLPDECWESVFKFLEHHNYRYLEPLSVVSKQFLSITDRLRSNFPLTICDPTLPFLPRLLHRFPTLTSINLTSFCGDLDELLCEISQYELSLRSLDISYQPKFPSDGLRELSKKVATLKSLRCSHVGTLKNSDLLLIAECFPSLEELDISFPTYALYNSRFNNRDDFESPVSNSGVNALSLGLPKLHKVNLSGRVFTRDSLVNLCINCELLEEIVIFECNRITQNCIAFAIKERPNLRSLSVNLGVASPQQLGFDMPTVTLDFIASLVSLKCLNCLDLSNSCISDELLYSVAEEGLPLRKLVLKGCSNYSYDGIFSLLSKCQLVQYLDLQKSWIMCDRLVSEVCVFLGNLISINLSDNEMVTGASFFTLTRNCPLLGEIRMENIGFGKQMLKEEPLVDLVVNSQVKSLHLARNLGWTDKSIKMFASICPNLEVLDLSSCNYISEGMDEVLKRCCKIRHFSFAGCWKVKMKFEAPTLEVLNLSRSGIDDEALSIISKSCYGLLHLDLEGCHRITAKGVKEVVENCKLLREISLKDCGWVAAEVVAWMVFSRPSLRKITAPPCFRFSEGQKELFLRHGCLIQETKFQKWRGNFRVRG